MQGQGCRIDEVQAGRRRDAGRGKLAAIHSIRSTLALTCTDEKLNLHSTVLQQKAVLALAQEQMQVIELERRLIQAETERGEYLPDTIESFTQDFRWPSFRTKANHLQ